MSRPEMMDQCVMILRIAFSMAPGLYNAATAPGMSLKIPVSIRRRIFEMSVRNLEKAGRKAVRGHADLLGNLVEPLLFALSLRAQILDNRVIALERQMEPGHHRDGDELLPRQRAEHTAREQHVVQLLRQILQLAIIGRFCSADVAGVDDADPDFAQQLFERADELLVGRLRPHV